MQYLVQMRLSCSARPISEEEGTPVRIKPITQPSRVSERKPEVYSPQDVQD